MIQIVAYAIENFASNLKGRIRNFVGHVVLLKISV